MSLGLAALDRWLTERNLAATRWGGSVSFRLGRWIQAGMAEAHSMILRTGSGLRIPYVGDDEVAAAGRGAPVTLPFYPSPELFAENAPERPCLERASWLDPANPSTTIAEQFLFHCLHPVAMEMNRHRRSGDHACLERAESIATRWMDQCLYRERPEVIWDEHITAMRALALCELWEAVRASGEGKRPFDCLLVASLLRHAIKLEPAAAYRSDHNHGVTQAFALLACALALGDSSRSSGWIELAIERLRQQMADNLSPEGILREHSPYYHFFVFRQYSYAERLARARGIALGDTYRTRLECMIEAGAHMIKPDGTLVAAGDGARTSPILVDPTDLEGLGSGPTNHFRYRRSAGREGAPATTPRLIAPEGGFAFLGSDPLRGAESTDAWHLALRLSTFPTTHIHRDALSFELYAEGEDLLTDSGGPYGYGSPARAQYFVRTRAHNTVTVDDADQDVGPCRILRSNSDPGFDALDVEHDLYRGVRHRRLTIFAPPDFVLIADWLDAPISHTYRQWWHFAPGLDVTREQNALAAMRPSGGPGVRILPLGPRDVTPRVERGTELPLQGWVCVGDMRMEPRWAAHYEVQGPAAVLAVLIVPERAGRPRDVRARVEFPAAGELKGVVEIDGRTRRLIVETGRPARLDPAP